MPERLGTYPSQFAVDLHDQQFSVPAAAHGLASGAFPRRDSRGLVNVAPQLKVFAAEHPLRIYLEHAVTNFLRRKA